MDIKTELVNLSKRLATTTEDTPASIAYDVASLIRRHVPVEKAFKNVGHSALYVNMREADLPRGWEHFDLEKMALALEKAIKKATGKLASGGMSKEVFEAKAKSLLKRIGQKYGGKVEGEKVRGETEHGETWEASISRQNASNGEVAALLKVSVLVNGGPRKFDYKGVVFNDVFEDADIPVVNSGIKL